MKNKTRLMALLLCLLLVLGACAGGEAEEVSGGDNLAKGRYLERQLAFPEHLTAVMALDQVAVDEYYLLGTADSQFADYEIWHSGDGGESWQQRRPAWLEQFDGDRRILSIAFTPAGDAYVSHSLELSEEEYVVETSLASGEGLRLLEQPALREYNHGLSLTAGGDLIVNNYFSLEQVNPEDGGHNFIYETTGMYWPGTYTLSGDELAVAMGDALRFYDLSTGEETGSVPLAAGGELNLIAPQPDGSGYFYLNDGGLYRVSIDGGVTEQLIDGALASFGMPSVSVQRMFVRGDGSFLLLCHGDNLGYQLQCYAYDPEVSRVPGQELTVYALQDSKFIRQVIGQYQREHPDVMVTLETGLSGEEDAVTVPDALRALSTRLLAGEGPDLLVLDGMPVDSYVDQNVLLDLSGLLETADTAPLHPVATQTYRYGEAIYALPTRFGVPMLGGVGIGAIRDLESLNDWLETQEDRRIGVAADTLLDTFYPILAPGWFEGDGSLNEAALRGDLEQLLRLAEMTRPLVNNYDLQFPYGFHTAGMRWVCHGQSLIFGTVRDIDDIACYYSAFVGREEGEAALFPQGTGGVFLPGGILGVNAAGPNTQLAGELVRFALSEGVQRNSFRDGLPVHRAALEDSGRSGIYEPGQLVSIGSSYDRETGEEFLWSSYQPTLEAVEEYARLLWTVDTPGVNNTVLRQLVLDEAGDYVAGVRSLDDTLSALSQKVERYLQEKQ